MSNNPIHLVVPTYHINFVYGEMWIAFDLRLHREESDNLETSRYSYSLINTDGTFQNPYWQTVVEFDSIGEAMDAAIATARRAIRREFGND